MRYLLDEMLDGEIAVQLRSRELDVLSIQEHAELGGLSDPQIFYLAHMEERVVVTENTRDYQRLHDEILARGEHHSGLLLSSSRSMPRHKGSIGLWIRVLEIVERTYPGQRTLPDLVRWLQPVRTDVR